jgi:hypothetical protein
MTTIAYDGKYLAGDSQSNDNGMMRHVVKVFKHKLGLFGISGMLTHGLQTIAWITDQGALPELYPKYEKDDIGYVTHIDRQGRIWRYEGSPMPVEFLDKFIACGSGRDFACAAMYLGTSAENAVAIASKFDVHTGGNILCYCLEDCP